MQADFPKPRSYYNRGLGLKFRFRAWGLGLGLIRFRIEGLLFFNKEPSMGFGVRARA